MPARNKFIRILKFLGKALLGLLILLFSIILLLHLPFVQRKITQRLATFLSSKMEARVDIKSIEFSMFGSVAIDSLQVWDPDNNKILSLGKIEVTTYIFNLLAGNYIIDDIHIKDFSGKLIQDEGGLNIQYILDAFQSAEKSTTPVDTTPSEIKLQFKNIILENIAFEYKSTVDGMDIAANLGEFTSENAEFSTGPNKFRVDRLHLQGAVVNILSAQQPDTVVVVVDSTINNYFSTDFGIRMGVEVHKLEIDESAFSYHVGQVIDPPKFDPSHITLKAIQLAVSDILIRDDTLNVGLQNLSVQTPGFNVSNVKTDAHMNRNQLNLEGFQFTSNENNLQANLTAEYNDDSNEIKKLPDLEITAEGLINPNDFAYFLDDSIMQNFNDWKTADLTLEANYIKGTGEIKTLSIKTENSNLQAKGKLSDLADMDKFSWNDFVVNTSIGADFQQLLKPYVSDLKLPPDIKIQLTSTGNPKKIFVDGKVNTTWGELNAKGETILLTDNIELDIHLEGHHVQPGNWMELPWLGPIDFSTDAKGTIGKEQDLAVKGKITSVVLMNEPVNNISFQSQLGKDNVKADISIADPDYLSQIHGDISFAGPMLINLDAQLDKFKLGKLLQRDSTLSITATIAANMNMDTASMEGHVKVKDLYVRKKDIKDEIDTLSIDALISSKSSQIAYSTKNGKGSVTANFDLRDMSTILQSMPNTIFGFANREFYPGKGRTLQFQLQMDDPRILMMAGIDIKDFSSIGIKGDWDEQKRAINVEANSAKFKGYGISLDTLHTYINSAGDSITAGTMVRNIMYNTIEVGDIDMSMKIKGDTAISHLLVSKDSVSLLVFGAHLMNKDSGLYVYPGQLHLFGQDFIMDPNNPVFIHNGNIMLEDFLITRDNMETSLDGDMHAFNMNFKNLDLKNLNAVMFPDSAVITNGYFNGMISYAPGQHLDLVANIDSLSLYHSLPLTIAVTAKKEENSIPFQFLMSNASNKVDVHGQYTLNDNQVDAALVLDVSNPELFSIVFAGVLDSIKGGIKGEATIRGPLEKPEIKGFIGFHDFGMTTTKPRMVLSVRDDKIRFDSSGILLDHFTLYDQQQRPLTISGYLHSRDYKSFAYDLKIKTDEYALIDNPESANVPLTGLMMIGADIHLSGNEKDKKLEANVTIKDTTNLTYTFPNDKSDLLNTFGIVEFVDPDYLIDTTVNEQSGYYDSLVASLPDIKLNAKIKIEEKAKLRVVTDQQSGDFFEASGSADLELGYDRTGNPRLVGNYTIKQGVYRMSFYDLVKKTFTLVPGSSITWSGSPESGDINIKATHTVATNSIGLVGHEIGENEKSVYKRTLDYEVGININGTMEKPIITFSLDLPEQDKASYPLLANKLDRLRLPEFQTELNKQVFGLLVLGGFLPETSVGDIDQSQIATTAVYNSINAILATQLNRFASQHVKGVSIDVGIQSYADYSTPGGKTQTAMDFRVSKSVFNDRLSFEVGGDFDISSDQSGANTGDNYRGDVAIIYDLTGNGDKQLKLFNNESYDIIYQEIRNTGISLIFIREFDKGDKAKAEAKAKDKAKAEAKEKAEAKAKAEEKSNNK